MGGPIQAPDWASIVTDRPASSSLVIDECSRRDGTAVLLVSGELDIASVPTLQGALDRLAAQHRSVVLNLRDVSFMDSTGLNLLVRTKRRADLNGWNMTIAPDVSPTVGRLFDLTCTTDYLILAADHKATG